MMQEEPTQLQCAPHEGAHLRFGVPLPPTGLAPVEVNAETKGLRHNNQLSSPPAQGRWDRQPAFFTTGARPVGSSLIGDAHCSKKSFESASIFVK
jgi:hypothetical protein